MSLLDKGHPYVLSLLYKKPSSCDELSLFSLTSMLFIYHIIKKNVLIYYLNAFFPYAIQDRPLTGSICLMSSDL